MSPGKQGRGQARVTDDLRDDEPPFPRLPAAERTATAASAIAAHQVLSVALQQKAERKPICSHLR